MIASCNDNDVNRLSLRLSKELGNLLSGKSVGDCVSIPPSADICYVLELFLPRVLRQHYREWEKESLDGIFVARATKTSVRAVELVGTCILISDQTVTPFLVELELSGASHVVAVPRLKMRPRYGSRRRVSWNRQCGEQRRGVRTSTSGYSMKLIDVFKLVLRESLVDVMEVEDVLMRAVVLHTHSIVLRPHVELEDVAESERVDGRFVLAPLTRRHVATLIAECWPADPRRGSEDYWLDRYEIDAPYELFGDVPRERSARALAAKKCIAGHPLVEYLIPE